MSNQYLISACRGKASASPLIFLPLLISLSSSLSSVPFCLLYLHLPVLPSFPSSFESDEVRFNLMALVTDRKVVYQRRIKEIQERVEAAVAKVGGLTDSVIG